MPKSLRCCLNPKVIGGLVVLGLVLWLLSPARGVAALPLLVALVCPLSMGVMAWRMRGPGSSAGPGSVVAGVIAEGAEDVDAQLRALREEVAIARARRQLADGGQQPLP